MSTSDPIRRPPPAGTTESLRRDIERSRKALAETLAELNDRLNPRRVARRGLRRLRTSPAPIIGAAVVFGAAGVATLASLRPPGRRMTAARVGVAGGIAALGTGVVAYAVSARRRRVNAVNFLSGSGVSEVTNPMGDRSADPGNPSNSAIQANPARAAVESDASASSLLGDRRDADPYRGGDVVDLLIAQHREVEAMFEHVLRAEPPNDRREAFASLVNQLQRHERAEQEIVHPILRALGGSAADVARDRLDEESQADRLLTGVIGHGVDSLYFAGGLEELRRAVAAHADHEETLEFPLLRAKVDAARLHYLANQVRASQRGTW